MKPFRMYDTDIGSQALLLWAISTSRELTQAEQIRMRWDHRREGLYIALRIKELLISEAEENHRKIVEKL